MTAGNGMSAELRRMPNGKTWAFVISRPDGSPVAFRDWFDMVRLIVECEVVKYGGDPDNPRDWEKWGRLPREFLMRCFDFDVDYDTLRREFGLPR